MDGTRALPLERSHLDLLGAAAAGDLAAFEALCRQHSHQVFRLALGMLGNREDAEDVQQETFVKAYQRLRHFRREASFGTWLYTIAARLCLSHRRRRTARTASLTAAPDAISSNPDPAAQLMQRESARRVQRTLVEMAPADRLIIVLKHIEELSHEEIAQILGCSPESSRSRLHRARRLFRERYERMCGDDDLSEA